MHSALCTSQGPSVPWLLGAASPLGSECQNFLVHISKPSRSVPSREDSGQPPAPRAPGSVASAYRERRSVETQQAPTGEVWDVSLQNILPESFDDRDCSPVLLARSSPVSLQPRKKKNSFLAPCPSSGRVSPRLACGRPPPASLPLGAPSHAVSRTPCWAQGWAADADGRSVCY